MVANQPDGSRSEAAIPDPFRIVSIASAAAPAGSTGANWHRYEICQGDNQIVGYRAGNIKNVTLAIEDIVYRLNDRRRIRRGRVHVVLQPGSSKRSR